MVEGAYRSVNTYMKFDGWTENKVEANGLCKSELKKSFGPNVFMKISSLNWKVKYEEMLK